MFSAGNGLCSCLDEPKISALQKDNCADQCTVQSQLNLFYVSCWLEHALNEDKERTYAGSPLLFPIIYLNFQVGEADYLLMTEGLCRELVLTSSNCVIRRV